MARDKTRYNEYLNNYMKERWRKRRAEAIVSLGGKCVECSSVDDLEFDHIDPITKIESVAKMSSASNKKFQEELDKCQLLCSDCHKLKHYAAC